MVTSAHCLQRAPHVTGRPGLGDPADVVGLEATVTASTLFATMLWHVGENKRRTPSRWQAARKLRDVLDEAANVSAGEVTLPALGPNGHPLMMRWGRRPGGQPDGVPVLAAPPAAAAVAEHPRPVRQRVPGEIDVETWVQGLGRPAGKLIHLWEALAAGEGYGVLESPMRRCHASELLVFMLMLPRGAWPGYLRAVCLQEVCRAMLGTLAALGAMAAVPCVPATKVALVGPSGRKRRRLDPTIRAAMLAPTGPLRGARAVVPTTNAIEDAVRYLEVAREKFGNCRTWHARGRSESLCLRIREHVPFACLARRAGAR